MRLAVLCAKSTSGVLKKEQVNFVKGPAQGAGNVHHIGGHGRSLNTVSGALWGIHHQIQAR